jgi:hypothetical protein
MSRGIFDALTVLIPEALYTGNQTLPPIQITTSCLQDVQWLIAVSEPPTANDVEFRFAIAESASGPWTDLGTTEWPNGFTGSQTMRFVITGERARMLLPGASWVRCELRLPGGSIRCQSWLTKVSGHPGVGAAPQDALGVT